MMEKTSANISGLGYCHIHKIDFEIEKFGDDCPECRKERSILKYSGAVKVMRSYDYCHFEIKLASSDSKTIGEIDEMRKEAARLADKAVKQYQIAKDFYQWKSNDDYWRKKILSQSNGISEIAEADRTPEQKAILKTADDIIYHMNRRYDYDDEWDDGYPERDDDDDFEF